MAEENFFKRRMRSPRQKWEPHWLLKLLYTLWGVLWSLAKIAIGAAATVLLIVLICGTVFVGILGNYLQDDILAEAADWSVEDYDLERTSFIYYVDNHGDIQQLQQIYTTTDRQWASLEEIPQGVASVLPEDRALLMDIMALPDKYKEPLLLYYYQDMTLEEIGKVLHITPSCVSRKLKRARSLLRKILEKEGIYHA